MKSLLACLLFSLPAKAEFSPLPADDKTTINWNFKNIDEEAQRLNNLINTIVITSTGIAAGSVDTTKISPGAVDTPKLMLGAVYTNAIQDGAIDTAKLGTDAVTAAKILYDGAALNKVSEGCLLSDGDHVTVVCGATEQSTMTIQGNQFSVGGSTFVINDSTITFAGFLRRSGSRSNATVANTATHVSLGGTGITDNSYATIGGGSGNSATGDISTVAGGNGNVASGQESFVGGGRTNTASATQATIGGGLSNQARDQYATIAGGRSNTTCPAGTNAPCTIGGGQDNTANAAHSTVAGGKNNSNTNEYGFIGGGDSNTLTTGYTYSVIGGGQSNTNTSSWSVIPGGVLNTINAAANYSWAGGRNAITSYPGTFIWNGDSLNGVDYSAWDRYTTTFVNPRGFRIIAGSTVAVSQAGDFSVGLTTPTANFEVRSSTGEAGYTIKISSQDASGLFMQQGNSVMTFGCRTAAQLRLLAPANHSATQISSVLNCTDFDFYTSTGSTTGQWRNTRTGTGP